MTEEKETKETKAEEAEETEEVEAEPDFNAEAGHEQTETTPGVVGGPYLDEAEAAKQQIVRDEVENAASETTPEGPDENAPKPDNTLPTPEAKEEKDTKDSKKK